MTATSSANPGQARIAATFARCRAEKRAALVTYVMAGDPDAETSLKVLQALPAVGRRHRRVRPALHRPDGRRPGDPGGRPARAQGAARASCGPSTSSAASATGNAETPVILMGYYNPIHTYGVERFLDDALGGRHRRADRRRPAAGGGRRALPAGARQGPRLHPPRHADHRRAAPAGRAREHGGLRLLRLDHRHHRHGDAGFRPGGRGGRPHPPPHRPADRGGLRRAGPARMPPRSPGAPTASWSARPSSTRCAAPSTRRARAGPGRSRPSAPWCASWPRASARLARAPDARFAATRTFRSSLAIESRTRTAVA